LVKVNQEENQKSQYLGGKSNSEIFHFEDQDLNQALGCRLQDMLQDLID